MNDPSSQESDSSLTKIVGIGLLIALWVVLLTMVLGSDESSRVEWVGLSFGAGALLLIIAIGAYKDLRSSAVTVVTWVGVVGVVGCLLYTLTFGRGRVTETISSKPIHLGNVTRQYFEPPKPSGTKEAFEFRLSEEEYSALSNFAVHITAKHVDPVLQSGPVVVLVNGSRIGFLNEYEPYRTMNPAEEGTHEPATVRMAVPKGRLIQGNNRVVVVSLPVKEMVEGEVVPDVDDINIFEVRISYDA